jgi:hypothetical protein
VQHLRPKSLPLRIYNLEERGIESGKGFALAFSDGTLHQWFSIGKGPKTVPLPEKAGNRLPANY